MKITISGSRLFYWDKETDANVCFSCETSKVELVTGDYETAETYLKLGLEKLKAQFEHDLKAGRIVKRKMSPNEKQELKTWRQIVANKFPDSYFELD